MKVLCKKTFKPFKKGQYYTVKENSHKSCVVYLVENFGYKFYYIDSNNTGGHNIFEHCFMTQKELRKQKLIKIINENRRRSNLH